MSISRNFEDFREEIELAIIQNACVEIELYSIIACILRESRNTQKISVRDVSTRRTSNISKRFKSSSGFPDFVILERKKTSDSRILGCVEIKMPTVKIYEYDMQIRQHSKYFKKSLYTNGITWMYFDKCNNRNNFIVTLGERKNNKILWNPDSWTDLLMKIDNIIWDDS